MNYLLNYRGDRMNDSKEVVMRDGIPIEKGIVLTKEFLDNN
jgi:hypothetical protein